MTAPEDGLEEALRRALHTALNQVEPGVDGLERIRARTRKHQPQPWLVCVATGAVDRARHFTWRGHWAWADSFPWLVALPWPRLDALPWPRLRLLPQGTGHVPAHAAPGSRSPRINGIAWMRPAAVLAGVVFIASVALAIPPFRQAIVQVSSTMLTGGHSSNGPGGSGGGAAAGSGNLPGSASRASTGKSNVSPAVTVGPCQPTASPSPASTQYVSTGGGSSSSPASTTAPGPGDLATPTIPTSLVPYATASPTACPSTSAKPSASPDQSPSQSPSPSTSASLSTSPSASSSPVQTSSPSQSPSPTVSETPDSPTPTATDSGTAGVSQGTDQTPPSGMSGNAGG